METKTLMIVFPLAAGAVGNRFVEWGFFSFLLLMQKSQITHTPKYTHSHKLIVSLDVFLCFTYIVYQHIFSACTSTFVWSMFFLWEYLTGLLPDLCSGLSIHPFIHPCFLTFVCSVAWQRHAFEEETSCPQQPSVWIIAKHSR